MHLIRSSDASDLTFCAENLKDVNIGMESQLQAVLAASFEALMTSLFQPWYLCMTYSQTYQLQVQVVVLEAAATFFAFFMCCGLRRERRKKELVCAYERFPAFVSILWQPLGATGGFDCMFSFMNLNVCAILYYFNAVFLSLFLFCFGSSHFLLIS